jgi:serine/threonine protein kinase
MGSMPHRIGPYRIEGKLGRGGVGEVFRAWDASLERWVAVKLCRQEPSRREAARGRLRLEAAATSCLSHSAIVEGHGLLETDEGDALVLELIEGLTLGQVLRECGPFPPVRLLPLAIEIAEGLAAAHAQGILHRDLKPENVMLTLSGHAKILDWSAAKRWVARPGEAPLTAAHAIVGTCRSMSPEQVCGLPLDPRSDLFSFGSLLYELASGHSPFAGQGTRETWLRICTVRQAPLAELVADMPEPFSRLVDGLLQKEPGQRPAAAGEVQLALAAIDPRAGFGRRGARHRSEETESPPTLETSVWGNTSRGLGGAARRSWHGTWRRRFLRPPSLPES